MTPAKHILLLGAGKSATVLIKFLQKTVNQKAWLLTVADHDLALVQEKIGAADLYTTAVQLDIRNNDARRSLIATADVVISLLPPSLHYIVACDCLELNKHLLTASYVDERIRSMEQAISEKGLLFLCEMGLDPGIDHMSALQLIHGLQQEGSTIDRFLSHCGGLVAPESDDNPWHYKISWNPRNVVLAGKAGAVYRKEHETVELPYEKVFRQASLVDIPGLYEMAYYPNRNSLDYIDIYGLTEIKDFIRTTLRHPAFCHGWQRIVELRLTDEQVMYDTNGMDLHQLLNAHFQQHQLSVTIEQMAETDLQRTLFSFLGFDTALPLNRGTCSMADILQWRMESSWVLRPGDKDMIVMLHEINYTDSAGLQHQLTSSLVVLGEDERMTAMAKTVGLPLGMAAVLILENVIQDRGLHIPIIPSIYEPVLAMLKQENVIFTETHQPANA